MVSSEIIQGDPNVQSKSLLAVAVASVSIAFPVTRAFAGPAILSNLIGIAATGVEEDDEKKGPQKHEEHDEKGGHEEKEDKEIEQGVPMNMVPATILDAVKKELPDGKVTEAELVAKHHKIVYSFDVKVGDVTYDVAISVDGKFVSKELDDDEKDGNDEKKPEMPEKK